jgi:hypothetical protein
MRLTFLTGIRHPTFGGLHPSLPERPQPVLRRHPPALLRAPSARLRAKPAVLVMRVLLALLSTRLAQGCAGAAELGGHLTSPHHRSNCCLTRLGALPIQANAPNHRVHMLLVETCVRAHLARDPAFDTRLDALVISLV